MCVCRCPLTIVEALDGRLILASIDLAKIKLDLLLCSASILRRKHLLSLVLVLDLTWSNSTFTYRCPLSSVKELFWLISLASN